MCCVWRDGEELGQGSFILVFLFFIFSFIFYFFASKIRLVSLILNSKYCLFLLCSRVGIWNMVMEYGVSCLPCFCWFFRHACTHTYPCVLGSSSVRNAKKKKGEGGEEDHTHIY